MKFEGEVREFDLIPALVELGEERFTGALRFENDSIIKIVYFKEGAVLSASTNDRLDSIDEILLKSGKVSREHVKQALSKRKDDETLGDALLGLGFITRKELVWARRVQLVGILRSITTWDAGSYTLVSDYLPKREEGSVFQLEQIVLELVLTDGNRAKYDTLLDSGNIVFRPSMVFEDRFPRLGLNQEAEAVVRLINGSRAASEVVAESTSDAFNVYKLMHALNVLGLLERSGGLDLGAEPPLVAPIDGTIEMPIDFGGALASNGAMDLGTVPVDESPATPALDRSWDMSTDKTGAPGPESAAGISLPSIGATVRAAQESPYDYQPSIPSDRMPSADWGEDVSSVESLGKLEIPEPPVPAEPDRVPVRKVMGTAPKRSSSSSSAARTITLLVVGMVVLAGLGYLGYGYFTRDRAQPVPQARVVPLESEDTPGAAATVEVETPPPSEVASTPAVPEATPEKRSEPAPVRQETPRATAQVAQPATAPSGRLADAARQHASAAASVPFTVQFALLCQESSVENSMRVGGNNFWFLPIHYEGRDCYRALWGRYSTRAEAEQGATTIPAALRGGKTVVVEPAKLGS